MAQQSREVWKKSQQKKFGSYQKFEISEEEKESNWTKKSRYSNLGNF